MNINRHNYEVFFLLYVDNELSAAEKKAVDVFVQENTDLQGELLLLQQTVVKADNIVLEKKDWLYMEEGISALQENLLLFADDELSATDKKAVEALLATDKLAHTEWNILQQTKLQPDTDIVFTDKQSLYRTEGGKVVGFKWWRAAAAAVLLGFGIWTGMSIYKNNFKTTTGAAEIARENKIISNQGKTEIPVNQTAAESQTPGNNDPQNRGTAGTEKNQADKLTKNNGQPNIKMIRQNTIGQKENITVRENSIKKPDNNLPESYLENINRNERNKIIVAGVLPQNNKNADASGVNSGIVKNNIKEKVTNSGIDKLTNSSSDQSTTAVIPVVYANTDTENNNDRILYMDENKAKRTALGGFLRKAKRMIERNTSIKTGDGLKVAGFEIALK